MSASLISQLVNSEIVSLIDVEAAEQISALAPISMSDVSRAIAALTLRAYRDGHACLALDDINSWCLNTDEVSLWPRSQNEWNAALSEIPSVFGTPADLASSPRPPFVVEHNRVYISRVYQEEINIAACLARDKASHVTIILGGPGTGKTFTVAQKLCAIPENEIPRLALCAPTGKASRHLRAVLDRQLRANKANDELMSALSNAPSTTAHRLLGYSPHSTPKFTFGAHETLPYELVIVDEASMMSLSMMNKLMESLSPNAELWLVGDPNQLASVEAGSVLADIAKGAESKNSVLHPHTTTLEKNYRFGDDSPIAQLAKSVNAGNLATVKSILESASGDIEWIDPITDSDRLASLVNDVKTHAQSIRDAAQSGQFSMALQLSGTLQVLSAQREGRFGVRDWNAIVESSLGQEASKRWYAGRPIMITRNDASLNLANGDVGVVCNDNGTLVAQFGDPDAPLAVSLARLSDVETVHALTIHKSQGSEYDHVIVVLPDYGSRVITRELLYTGITRPKSKLTVVATLQAISTAVSTPVRRASGLADRL